VLQCSILGFSRELQESAMTTAAEIRHLQEEGLYQAGNEHDACGVGFVAHIKGEKSHNIVQQALKILENLDHRGAVGADKLMGDGAGILIQMPDKLYREEMRKQGIELPPPGEYGVGMIFLPKEHASRLACEQELERAIKAECSWAGATCRSTATCRCRPRCAPRSRSSARFSWAAAPT
jgi:glutamate synthase domain-containing protein 1